MFKKSLSVVAMAVALLLGTLPAYAVPTDLTPFSPPAITASPAAGTADSAFVACDSVNGNSFTSTGREMIEFQNTGASAYTVTINSVADPFGRTADVTAYSIAATNTSVFGPFPVVGWRQTNGKVNFTASNVAVKVRIIRIPPGF